MNGRAGALAGRPGGALAGVSWHTLAGMTLAVFILTAALCWTLSPTVGPSPGGSAMLISRVAPVTPRVGQQPAPTGPARVGHTVTAAPRLKQTEVVTLSITLLCDRRVALG